MMFKAKLIRAGAGTGKTTRLVGEVYQCWKDYKKVKGQDPRLIVCTFTRKASQELKERLFEKALKDLKGEGSEFLAYLQSPSLYISTIDGILNMFLRRYGHRMGLSPDFQIYENRENDETFDSLAEEFLFEKNLHLLKKLPYPYLKEIFLFYFKQKMKYGDISFYDEKDFESFNKERNLFLSLKDSGGFKKEKNQPSNFHLIREYFLQNKSPLADLLNDEEDIKKFKDIFSEKEKEESRFDSQKFLPLFKEIHKFGEEFFPVFLEEKKNKAFLNLEDLLLFSLSLLKESPQTAGDFSKEWDYWLIDEYQDTSWVQEQILFQVTSGFQNVFCVGDPGQSIYFFRGSDPEVFQRREQALKNQVEILNTNYRSTASLIHFYNDFFKDFKNSQGSNRFIKFQPEDQHKVETDKTSVHFFTYDKDKEEYKHQVFSALYYYICELRSRGSDYNDIAILSSRNDSLKELSGFLRSRKIPLKLEAGSITGKRLVLDSLFLLKFIINPHDDTHLKALLRTPYFYMSDERLFACSKAHEKFCKEKEKTSFWNFLKKGFFDEVSVKSLSGFLEMKEEKGFVKSFEKALMDSGMMDLSYFQDPSGASESDLWNFISLLNKDTSSPLELFYNFMDETNPTSPPPCESAQAVPLMSIHKAKGLEFKHVIILDFSIAESGLKSGGNDEKLIIFDKEEKKMSFSVPQGRRDSARIKCYGQELNNQEENKKILAEKDRLLYVAMTRAKESLALFVPENLVTRKNSWLKKVRFFERFAKNSPSLLDKTEKACCLKEGNYKSEYYGFRVRSSKALSKKKPASVLTEEKNKEGDVPLIFKESSRPKSELMVKSSQDFVKEVSGEVSGSQKVSEDEEIFHPVKALNMTLKRNIGSQLHFFLQKLTFLPFEEVQDFIDISLLSDKDKGEVKEALTYVHQLKNPEMKKFLRTGFSEWPFQLQRQNVLLKGQMDLWALDSDEIHLFDYKSSLSQSSSTEKQLVFYAGVLSKMYPAKKVWMYGLYPFQKKTDRKAYTEEDRALFENWLNQIESH